MPYNIGDRDLRPWGSWEVLCARDTMVIKRITICSGKRLSLQRHRHRREDWIITAGEGVVIRGEIGSLVALAVAQWSSVTIEAGVVHRIENHGTEPLVLVEVQSGNHLDEDDIERFEDDYGRAD